jgi:hypothetical protein
MAGLVDIKAPPKNYMVCFKIKAWHVHFTNYTEQGLL